MSVIRGPTVSVQQSQAAAGTPLPVNVATTSDLDNLKRELTLVVQAEIATAKRDILDGKSHCWKFLFFMFSFSFSLLIPCSSYMSE